MPYKGSGKAARTCEQCGVDFSVQRRRLLHGGGRLCPSCRAVVVARNRHFVGQGHPRWKGGRRLRKGYIVLTIGPNTRVLEHRFVWEQAHGPIPVGYVIHHRNDVKTDNRLENLALLTNSQHRSLHARRDRLQGRWALRWECCQRCGTTERPHLMHGYCKRCYGPQFSGHPPPPVARSG